jgi:hypothetical protein
VAVAVKVVVLPGATVVMNPGEAKAAELREVVGEPVQDATAYRATVEPRR